MSKRPKGSGRKVCFSLVHQYIQHFNEKAGNKSAAIRRRSKIPGVIITQYTLNIPEGKSVPDFKRKVNQVNVQEGKLGVFKALVTAEPKPQVTWKRVRGSISDKQKYQTKYDDSTGEYILEVRAVTGEDEDTYKCIAVNDYGKAICSTTLNVTDHVTDPSDFRKMLRKTNSNIFEENQTEKTKERDERYRDTLQRDYDGLGTTDMHLMHLKMEERQRALKYQKGMSPPDEEILMKNGLINGGNATDAENLTIPNLDFVVKLQEAITEEKDTALFECVLTHPLPEITWMSKGNVLEDGEKYKITVSDHKMIHRLQIQNCSDEDKGDYSAVAGNASCTAPLDVEADLKAAGKKKTEGAGIDLEEVVRQQQKKNQEEMEMILEAVKAKHDAGELTEQKTLTTYGEDGEIISLTGPVQYSGSDVHDANDNSNIITSMLNVLSPSTGEKSDVTEDSDAGNQMEEETANAGQDGANACDDVNTLFCADGANACDDVNTLKKKKYDSLFNEDSENEEVTGFATQPRRKRIGPLIEDKVIDPGVQFIWGLSDINAIIGENAELTCKLSKEDCEGVWFRDGVQIITDDTFIISKEGAIHKLFIMKCQEEYSGKYRFEADNRKTEATVNVKDPPRFDPEDLSAFTEPLRIKVGHNAVFKLNFLGFEPIKIQWYREGEELHDDASSTRIEKATNHSRLLLSRCQRRDSGEIKIKLKNEHGTTEAITQLIVLDKPTTPLGPAEITLSSATCIEFKWRPPKDDGGSPVINYIMERQQIGRNTWKKIGEIPGVPFYRDTDVDRGRKYCYRIRALTSEGVSEVMETEDLQAGILAFPSAPAPPKVVSAFDDCINLTWTAPSNTGGSQILGYIVEKRKKGSNLWTVVNASNEPIKEKKCSVKDVVTGMEYEFRVLAVNLSGPGEFSNPCDFVFARDPKKPPGKVIGLKVAETSYNHFVLTWTKPQDKPDIQDEAKGYFVEIRNAQCLEWSRIFTITTTYTAKGLRAMDMYWVRVIATNDGGEGEIEELPNYVLAMPPLVRPKFTNKKMKTFMVVRAGNSVRVTINFEASPPPDIMWLKDNGPVPKRVTVSNSDGASQMLIPLSERSDSGIYSILVKNLAGQETFSTEVRVTDDPKPPGPVEIEENVPGTVQVTWQPSPDEKLDDRLHYTISKLDSTKHTWTTVADRLFNNKFTVCNIMHGREYHFRVYAKNDMGVSAPSESATWAVGKKKEKLSLILPNREEPDLRCAPDFIVPLKLHAAPKGYECYMSCAVTGNPKPRITWYRNHVCLNTDTNYYISNTCGVCSMLILSVGPKDVGKYTVTAENTVGRSECSTMLSVRE
ncbi:immunoglobulin-like and fibronectin type III domain-containing protein 1 isoform X1 [Corythoichthys intestinalis]|uniref:immunoglobulin-like and fibronectin type III domain-containing protein 1 isoform X1 n=1 Tax=Corythoichthys intestinalis TaxID=161448 RepID=UPI0025A4F4C8|nr:immunoglobulin-like and fibronectin type III domain-containing protein 1 isoform X1 [Corythoichthys intestinalis]XP_057714112.1 immunoglobulin-like and fibronectin type III domain-containing protein 1 isoform X1 [Corythoichthys intestinalis]